MPPEIAERLVVLGFFDEVISQLPCGPIADDLRLRVSNKLDLGLPCRVRRCRHERHSPSAAFDELADGTARKFVVDGVAVAVVRIGDDVYAIGDICSHADVSLSRGRGVVRRTRDSSAGSTAAPSISRPESRAPCRPHSRCPCTTRRVVDGQIVVSLEESS